MNYRKLPFDDLQSADNWLTEALLNRQAVSADRLLETTRLTDLIYTGCSFEDVYYGTHRADQPVNAESLAADIFAALFSPVLRRKDTDNVNLRERLFNKPVLDRLLSDDRFDRMKGMCENKELPSYAAAASFAGSFSRYHGMLRAQLASPLRKFCKSDFAAEFLAESLLTWTMAGKPFDEIFSMMEALF